MGGANWQAKAKSNKLVVHTLSFVPAGYIAYDVIALLKSPGLGPYQPSLRLVTDQVSGPTWACMLAEVTSQAVLLGGDDFVEWLSEHHGLYHLAGSGYCSRFEWGQEVIRLDPHKEEQVVRDLLPASTNEFPTPARRPLFLALNCDSFTQTFQLRLPDWKVTLKLAMEIRMNLRVLSIFGTRPESVKMAPVVQSLAHTPGIDSLVCVTAQHREMLDQVLGLFNIVPDIDLDLMQPDQSLASLTAEIFTHLDPVLTDLKPDWIIGSGRYHHQSWLPPW